MAKYLTPADICPQALEVVRQLASWNDQDGTWEVGIPVPANVVVNANLDIDQASEVHTFMGQNGLTYGNISCDGKAFRVLSIEY